MEATELRFGNYLLLDDKIVEFDSHVAWHISKLRGIPTTTELLLDLGFHEGFGRGIFHISITDDCMMSVDLDGNLSVGDDCHIYGEHVFIHQIQNVYSSLTKKELKSLSYESI